MRRDITQAEFYAYETVRLSGVTNMYLSTTVEDLSGLTRKTIRAIQEADYAALREKYGVPDRIKKAAEEMRADHATI